MLKIKALSINYGGIKAVKGVSLHLPEGQIVALIGSNGAGKSSILQAISGLVQPSKGEIFFDQKPIHHLETHQIVKAGISHVPEGRKIFANLTVQENLEMGAYLQRDQKNIKKQFEYIFSIFPRLKERLLQLGGTLSGGEQQMLAISRALMAQPKVLLLDEPSLGLAPILVKTIFQQIVNINQTLGVTMLLVEQNANLALQIAHYGYVLETGEITLQGPAQELAGNPEIKKAYLGK